MINEQHLSLGINMRGGYAQDSLRLEIPEAQKSEMNKDHRIWRTNEDHWIRVVGQKNTSTNQGINKYTWNNQMMVDHCQQGTCYSQSSNEIPLSDR
jgi:hypothetical protein